MDVRNAPHNTREIPIGDRAAEFLRLIGMDDRARDVTMREQCTPRRVSRHLMPPAHGTTSNSEAAIQFCLTMKSLFNLPLRQAMGMTQSLLRLAGLDWQVPDFSTVSRRQKHRAVTIGARPTTTASMRPRWKSGPSK